MREEKPAVGAGVRVVRPMGADEEIMKIWSLFAKGRSWHFSETISSRRWRTVCGKESARAPMEQRATAERECCSCRAILDRGAGAAASTTTGDAVRFG
jgi:hypothetical protein